MFDGVSVLVKTKVVDLENLRQREFGNGVPDKILLCCFAKLFKSLLYGENYAPYDY